MKAKIKFPLLTINFKVVELTDEEIEVLKKAQVIKPEILDKNNEE